MLQYTKEHSIETGMFVDSALVYVTANDEDVVICIEDIKLPSQVIYGASQVMLQPCKDFQIKIYNIPNGL